MKRWIPFLMVGLLLLSTSQGWALTRTGMMGEDFAVRVHDSLLGVWLPLLALGCLIALSVSYASGHPHGILNRVFAAVIILAILQRGGIPIFSDLVGGAIASGAELSRQEVRWVPPSLQE